MSALTILYPVLVSRPHGRRIPGVLDVAQGAPATILTHSHDSGRGRFRTFRRLRARYGGFFADRVGISGSRVFRQIHRAVD